MVLNPDQKATAVTGGPEFPVQMSKEWEAANLKSSWTMDSLTISNWLLSSTAGWEDIDSTASLLLQICEEASPDASDGAFVSMQRCENLCSITTSGNEVTSGEDSGTAVHGYLAILAEEIA